MYELLLSYYYDVPCARGAPWSAGQVSHDVISGYQVLGLWKSRVLLGRGILPQL